MTNKSNRILCRFPFFFFLSFFWFFLCSWALNMCFECSKKKISPFRARNANAIGNQHIISKVKNKHQQHNIKMNYPPECFFYAWSVWINLRFFVLFILFDKSCGLHLLRFEIGAKNLGCFKAYFVGPYVVIMLFNVWLNNKITIPSTTTTTRTF